MKAAYSALSARLWLLFCIALVVIPLVMHGITTISRLQLWTQPLWLGLLLLPYLVVFYHQPDVLRGLWAYGGEGGYPADFDLSRFGAALTVGVALITQMGEQADYLRFMPARTEAQRRRWWLAVLWGGPGWVLPGIAKMLGGALLAWLALVLLSVPLAVTFAALGAQEHELSARG